MQLFIKAAEVWQPDMASTELQLVDGYYGGLSDFEAVSKEMSFPCGVGLPGETWEKGRPLLWSDLTSDAFMRNQIARHSGIACGLSIPIYAGDFLLAVVVLFAGRGSEVTGAVEVWDNESGSDAELRLAQGYYGELERFEWISRRLSILRGRGLPGGAWAQGKPLIIENLGDSNTFLRARNAAEAGITTGLAVPFIDRDRVRVVTFLSARGTPVMRRFEVWEVDDTGERLVFGSGHCESGTDLNEKYAQTHYTKGKDFLGELWLTGRPLIRAGGEGTETGLWIPQIVAGRLSAVVGFIF